MARSRRAKAPKQASEANQVSDKNPTETKGEQNRMADNTLNQEQIAEILSGSRTRGAGTEVIKGFLDSGEAGIEVDLTTGPLAGKEPGAAYTTLLNAKKRTKTDDSGATVLAMPEAANVQVRKRNLGDKNNEDWHIFLINTELVDLA